MTTPKRTRRRHELLRAVIDRRITLGEGDYWVTSHGERVSPGEARSLWSMEDEMRIVVHLDETWLPTAEACDLLDEWDAAHPEAKAS